MNFGYTYPVYARLYPTYNDPLLAAVRQAFALTGEPISFVDVGAAVGDTALLVEANCPGMLKEVLCIDGDEEFLQYLRPNLASVRGSHVEAALLNDGEGQARELLRIHGGTASAQGEKSDRGVPFDVVFGRSGLQSLDVLKIDVDGFDGVVLAGAKGTLRRYRPIIIFEWHPLLCRATGSDWMRHWDELRSAGYTRLVWFTKFGGFSHFGSADQVGPIRDLAQFCLAEHVSDWHYDVVALPDDGGVDPVDFAGLAVRVRKVSQW